MKKAIKITYLLFASTIISIILHNAIFGVFQIEEAFFFILSLLLALAFLLSVLYNLYTYIRHRKPKDIWKLGFIGLFALIAVIPGFPYSLFGFFAFFAFFGLKK